MQISVPKRSPKSVEICCFVFLLFATAGLIGLTHYVRMVLASDWECTYYNEEHLPVTGYAVSSTADTCCADSSRCVTMCYTGFLVTAKCSLAATSGYTPATALGNVQLVYRIGDTLTLYENRKDASSCTLDKTKSGRNCSDDHGFLWVPFVLLIWLDLLFLFWAFCFVWPSLVSVPTPSSTNSLKPPRDANDHGLVMLTVAKV